MLKTHTINTSIAEAFFNACVKAPQSAKTIVNKCLDAYDKKAGQIKRNDWNASLTLKTYKQLKQQGIMA